MDQILRLGADKVSINTAVNNKELMKLPQKNLDHPQYLFLLTQ